MKHRFQTNCLYFLNEWFDLVQYIHKEIVVPKFHIYLYADQAGKKAMDWLQQEGITDKEL